MEVSSAASCPLKLLQLVFPLNVLAAISNEISGLRSGYTSSKLLSGEGIRSNTQVPCNPLRADDDDCADFLPALQAVDNSTHNSKGAKIRLDIFIDIEATGKRARILALNYY